jgi:hypothetical protein
MPLETGDLPVLNQIRELWTWRRILYRYVPLAASFRDPFDACFDLKDLFFWTEIQSSQFVQPSETDLLESRTMVMGSIRPHGAPATSGWFPSSDIK